MLSLLQIDFGKLADFPAKPEGMEYGYILKNEPDEIHSCSQETLEHVLKDANKDVKLIFTPESEVALLPKTHFDYWALMNKDELTGYNVLAVLILLPFVWLLLQTNIFKSEIFLKNFIYWGYIMLCVRTVLIAIVNRFYLHNINNNNFEKESKSQLLKYYWSKSDFLSIVLGGLVLVLPDLLLVWGKIDSIKLFLFAEITSSQTDIRYINDNNYV